MDRKLINRENETIFIYCIDITAPQLLLCELHLVELDCGESGLGVGVTEVMLMDGWSQYVTILTVFICVYQLSAACKHPEEVKGKFQFVTPEWF